MALEIITIPCLSDNYVYLLRDGETGTTAVVDCPTAPPVLAELEKQGWSLDMILLTHHHWDHVDGVEELARATGAKIIGAKADAHRLPPLDTEVAEGDRLQLGNLNFEVLDVSGHTVGHVAYVFHKALAVFTGDSLMAWGCGRVFEGTMEMMWNSLQKFHNLPRAMNIYSGHEYTILNGKFALTIEPDNESLHQRMAAEAATRAKDGFTVPSLLGLELATNPFLRAGHIKVKTALDMQDATNLEVFTEIRTRKDNF